jgi:serine/threonine protein kinase
VDGTPFGRYPLIELLGRGGMGEVWLAFDTVTKRTVALKVLLGSFAYDKRFIQRFTREAEVAARLNNPHIIPIHNYGEIDGRLYVDMRYVEGRDLEQVLADGPLEPQRAVRIIEEVAKALHAAHKVGLVHRDVKPSNILLDEDDFAYLIDFGIARAADDTRLTETGLAPGTLRYMAPERLRENPDEEDAHVDIYALTCVFYECLTGRPPFAGTSHASLIAAHLNTPPPRSSTTQPNLPAKLDEVIATGMAKDPERRYQTTLELAAAAKDAITQPMSADSAESTPLDVLDVEFEVEEEQRRSNNPFESLADRLGVGKGTAVMAVIFAAFVVVVFLIVIAAKIVKHESSSSNPQITSQTPASTSGSVAPPPPAVPALPITTTTPPMTATSSTTQSVTTVAVDTNGQPTNGYHEVPNGTSFTTLDACYAPAGSARTKDVYDCFPVAAQANTCWPAPPAAMLCLVDDNPWAKTLRRFAFDTRTLQTMNGDWQPQPFALLLDDGTRCTGVNSPRAFAQRDDGYFATYDCGAAGSVLDPVPTGDLRAPDIDQSGALWTVKVGQVGGRCDLGPCAHFPAPETHTVTTPWFSG